MSNASHSPFSPSSFLVVLTIVIHLQILKIQTILMTGHLIHTRQTAMLANSSSPIQAPRNGACFFLFPYIHGVWQWPLSHFSWRYSTLPFAIYVPFRPPL